MASVQLRRVRSADPHELQRVVNTLVDMFLGNQTGRLNFDGDGGLTRALQGGDTLASAVPVIQVRPASGEQFWMKHSNGTDTVLRGRDAGVTAGVPFSGTSGAFSGNVTITGTLGVTGAATVGGTLGVTGLTSLTTLATSGLATLNSLAVTNAATVGTTLSVGATPASTGTIRTGAASSWFAVLTSGGANVRMVAIDASDNLQIGATSGIAEVQIFGTSGSLRSGANSKVRWSATGVGFNGTAGVAPPALGGAAGAVYGAGEQTLLNNIRSCLQDNGLAT
jgi:hypothetical protein